MLLNLGKPKKPASAYGLFIANHESKKLQPGEDNQVLLLKTFEACFELIHCYNSLVTLQTRFRRMADAWKNLPKQEKQPYYDQATVLKINYDQEMKEWENKMLERFDMKEAEVEDLRMVI